MRHASHVVGEQLPWLSAGVRPVDCGNKVCSLFELPELMVSGANPDWPERDELDGRLRLASQMDVWCFLLHF